MKATGIVRQVDELGRIVLPIELRRSLDIGDKEPLEIYVDGERIILQKYAPGCALCGNIEKVRMFREKLVCETCVTDISDLLAKI